MNTCTHTCDAARYHDGELSHELKAMFEKHLQTCQSCRQELASLESMRSMFHEDTHAQLRPLALAQLHQQLDQRIARQQGMLQERGVLKLAQWLTAVAAMVLVVSGLQFFLMTNQSVAADTRLDLSWEMTTAMLGQGSNAPDTITSEHQMAAWIVTDLASESTGGVR